MTDTGRQLSFLALIAMVVGSMVGAGIFALPRSFGAATGVIGAVLAWTITGFGMYALARVFQMLADKRPDLDAGIFSYAKAGFGHYAGFLAAVGYWLVGCIADVSYWVLIKSTLGAAFPIFGEGNTIVAVIVSSIGVWFYHLLILRGIKGATTINTIVTFAKVIPILAFIALVAIAFNAGTFTANLGYAGVEPQADPGLFEQVRSTLLITIFVFIGIEGASVYSRYARKRSDVGRATILGFLIVLVLLVLVTLLPYATMPRAELAGLRQPSMASALEVVTGPWGRVFVGVGLIVSVLGAYLAWSLIAIEVLFAAAKAGDVPKFLAHENRVGVPSASLWLSNAVIQVLLILTLFSDDAFTTLVKLTSTMVLVPYLFSALFAVKVVLADRSRATGGLLFWTLVASIFAALMILAAGLHFLLLSALFYAPSTILFVIARREQGARVFTTFEWFVFMVLLVAAAAGVYGLMSGAITI
ncbi:MAG TPA: basic amino acid/polyamine antiporter [Devosia sp.]|nr:basic amino acid/polyamine antiporter [Devosia sp.]